MYRIIIENDAVPVRTVEYQSRREAYKYFASTAISRHTVSATLQKQTNNPDGVGPHWSELATVMITPENNVHLPE